MGRVAQKRHHCALLESLGIAVPLNRLGQIWEDVNGLMAVPMGAALPFFIVACVKLFQHALQDHMQPVKGAMVAAQLLDSRDVSRSESLLPHSTTGKLNSSTTTTGSNSGSRGK